LSHYTNIMLDIIYLTYTTFRHLAVLFRWYYYTDRCSVTFEVSSDRWYRISKCWILR